MTNGREILHDGLRGPYILSNCIMKPRLGRRKKIIIRFILYIFFIIRTWVVKEQIRANGGKICAISNSEIRANGESLQQMNIMY